MKKKCAAISVSNPCGALLHSYVEPLTIKEHVLHASQVSPNRCLHFLLRVDPDQMQQLCPQLRPNIAQDMLHHAASRMHNPQRDKVIHVVACALRELVACMLTVVSRMCFHFNCLAHSMQLTLHSHFHIAHSMGGGSPDLTS
jgi:hypothetical protein